MSTDELANLGNEAAAVDADVQAALEPPPPPEIEPPAPEPAVDPAEEWRAVIDVAVSLAVPYLPSLERVWTPDARRKLAKALAPLMAKYGLSVGDLFARWKEEIEFAFIALPLTLETIRAVQADRAPPAKKSESQSTGSVVGITDHPDYKPDPSIPTA